MFLFLSAVRSGNFRSAAEASHKIDLRRPSSARFRLFTCDRVDNQFC